MIDYDKYKHANFKFDCGRLALVKCPACDLENYAPNVISGLCTWCGFDINAKKVKYD